MHHSRHLAVAAAVVIGLATASLLTISAHRTAPANLYPDSRLTPGKIATSDFNELTSLYGSQTYSKAHRNTSSALKQTVHDEYPTCASPNEIDHLVPLALGGDDSQDNLWCEAANLTWNGENYGFHTKDALENYLVIQMKSGMISVQDAQQCILQDWVACYQKYKQYLNVLHFGSVSTGEYDGDDEIEQ